MKAPGKKTSGFFISVFLLCLLAFFLRLETCRELLKNDTQVSNPSILTDMATYRNLALKIYEGKFNEAFYYQPFYYAVFLPSVIAVAGKGIWPFFIAQSFLSSLTVLFTALTCAILKGRRSGIIAAFLIVFCCFLCFYVPYHLMTTLQAFWLSFIAYISVLAFKKGKVGLWFLCGAAVSCSILTRGNSWFLVPGLAVAAFLSGKRKSLNISLVFLFAFIAMVILPQLPFSFWNWKITGKISGPSTAAGAVLALGNTPEAPPGGRNPGTGPGPMEYPETYYDWASQSEKIHVSTQILRWFREEPLAFIELQIRKLLLFWDHREIPNNIAFEYQGVRSFILTRICVIPSSALICGFLAFIVSRVLNKKYADFKSFIFSLNAPLSIPICIVISYWFATAAFYNLARFKDPLLPLFAVFSAFFADDIITALRTKKYRRIKSAAAGLLIAIFIVFLSYDLYRFYEPSVMKIARPNGTRVRLSDGRLLILDNGPVSFGGWTAEELKTGMTIKKTFKIPESKFGKPAKFAISLIYAFPGETILEINGIRNQFTPEKEGLCEKIFDIGRIEKDEVEIKIVFTDGRPFFLTDLQRNYGRTFVEGEKSAGELVCRLYCEEEKKQ